MKFLEFACAIFALCIPCSSTSFSSHQEAARTASAEPGTFENPSASVRPKFRYWIPDASVDPATVASDVHAAGQAGAGGLELLGYYLYGGPPSNGAGRGTAAPVSWAENGFGTEAWRKIQYLTLLKFKI